jgi:hypothetical protein
MIDKLKTLITSLPEMRWNISESEGYFGDEWDNWEHMDENERFEYFGKIFSTIKKIKDIIELYEITKDDIFVGKKLYKYKNDLPQNRTECYISDMDMFPMVRVNDNPDFLGFSNIVDINTLCLNKNN